MNAALSLALASCLACAPAAPSPRAGDVIIEDTDTPPSPNPGAEDKAATRVRFVSLTPDILYEVDPARYVDDARTLAGAQLFYGARPDLLGAQIACVAPYAPIWRQELAERKKSIVWGRLDNLWPKQAQEISPPKGTSKLYLLDYWARPSTAFYAWKHPQNANKRLKIDFTLWNNWATADQSAYNTLFLALKKEPVKSNLASLVATGQKNTTQRSFRETPWEDMLERRIAASDLKDECIADADRVKTWLEWVNKAKRNEALSPINEKKCRWIEDWMEHWRSYFKKTAWPGKKRALSLNWSETFHQTLNQSVELYDGFLCLKNDNSLIDVDKQISANQKVTGHGRVVPFDARVKWSGNVKTMEKGKEVMREKVFLESDIAKAVVISDENAPPDFVVLAVACDCIKAASAEDAITILKEFRGKEVAVAEYIAEGTISGTGGKDSPLTYATGIEYAKGTGTGNLGSFTVKTPETLRYNRSVARLRSEETAAAYKAGITPRYKILFAVKETLATDPAKLTLTGDATKTLDANGKPAPLEENEGGNSLNGYTYVNMAVALNSATNITPVGSGSIELFRLPPPPKSDKNPQPSPPPPPAKYRLFQADVQAAKALENDIRMGFMDYTWTLSDDNKGLGTDSSRIGRVFAVFGESTLKCQIPVKGSFTWKLALSKSLRETLAQSPGADLALNGNSMDTDAMRSLRQSLLSGGFITLTMENAPVLSCRQGSSGAYRELTEGSDYACTAIRDMKEAQPPSCERPWIDALETLTRHLLLQSKLDGWSFTWPNTDGLRNAVGVFTQGMRVMSDYNNELLDAEFRLEFLQYTSEEYYRQDRLTLLEVDLAKYSRKICGGDHPLIICTEGVALSHALLSLCGMEYASLTRLRHPVYDHVQLGFGTTVFEPTPDEGSNSNGRGGRLLTIYNGEISTDPPGIKISNQVFVEQKELIMLGTPHPTR